MRTSTFSTALIAFLASTVTAIPIASEGDIVYPRASNGDIETRSTDIGVYFCKAWGFGTPCLYNRYQYAVCYNVPGDYNDQISAFGPDQNQGYCDVYPNSNCKTASSPSGHLAIGYPGYSSLSGGTALWNDVISSFICWP